jgi:uncharacterized protein (TIGR02145 family)
MKATLISLIFLVQSLCFAQLASWNNDQFKQIETKSGRGKYIWLEANGANRYEEDTIMFFETGKVEVYLNDLSGRNMQVKLVDSASYWKSTQNLNWTYLYTGNWKEKPSKRIYKSKKYKKVGVKNKNEKSNLVLNYALVKEKDVSDRRLRKSKNLFSKCDSLTKLLSVERTSNSENTSALNTTIINLQAKINELTTKNENLNSQLNKRTSEMTSNNNLIQQKQDEINKLQSELKTKIDSLTILRTQLTNQKPNTAVNNSSTNSSNATLISNTNNNTTTNSTTNTANQFTQTGSYKSVKIGTQTWMAENLNVSTFRNGDLIPEVKTKEEWKRAGDNKQPAWCYYDNDPKNGAIYGKLYNWYAVIDPRGLAPAGWHVPSDTEWTALGDYLGNTYVAGKKMKSTSGWNSWDKALTCENCKIASVEYKKICSVCKGTGKNGTKTHSGNGTNSSGFSGLPGGYCFSSGGFLDLGKSGFWWSSTETIANYNGGMEANVIASYAHYRSLDRTNDFLMNVDCGRLKDGGLSVRCVKD